MFNKWLFTSTKTGEVLRKRTVDNKVFLAESFLHTALADAHNSDGLVALLWPRAPSVAAGPGRILNRAAFDDVMKNLSSNLGDSCALQVGRQRGWRGGGRLCRRLHRIPARHPRYSSPTGCPATPTALVFAQLGVRAHALYLVEHALSSFPLSSVAGGMPRSPPPALSGAL